MENISVLRTAISKLTQANMALERDSYTNPQNKIKNQIQISRNKSMILDYQFRIKESL